MTNSISDVINLTEERFKSVAPKSISYEAEKGFAMQLLMNNSYLMKVAEGNNASLAQAITNVAAIGLSLNPAEKLAYLIPRNTKEGDRWVSKIYLEPSYMGLCKLATNSGAIDWVQANCVYAEDEFIDNGFGERPTHKYKAFSKDRGGFVGVYCLAKTGDGDFLTTLMTAEEVNGIMERSEAVKSFRSGKGNGGPWISDFSEQAKKTVVRRAFKMWPRTTTGRMAEAVDISNQNEGFEPILTSPKIKDFTSSQKEYYDQLIEKSDSLEMYILLSTIDETVRNNLYHSFEKGSKGRYQRIVDELYKNGYSMFTDCLDAINSGAECGDDLAVMEVVESLSPDALNMMSERFTPEAKNIIEESKAD